jgi:alkanesulfonate monooxygenase SsuD/methylene tetrahydromethanopterin reductase-like flavin-dependent oxidoreductase (luciferase family)
MQTLRALFAGSPASFEGRFTHFENVSIEPLPAQPGGPPLWVGGRSAPALRTAGRLGDGWLPIWVSAEQYGAGWSEIRRHAEEAGRDAEGLVPAAVVPALVDDDGELARKLAREHLEERYATTFSPHAIERYGLAGTPAECAARARAYAEAGVRHLVLNPVVSPDRLLEQVERLADAVMVATA